MALFIWIVSIIGTIAVASTKGLPWGWYLFGAVFTGPLAFIFACIVPSKSEQEASRRASNMPEPSEDIPYIASQLRDLKATVERCRGRISTLELSLDKYLKGLDRDAPISPSPEAPPAEIPVYSPILPAFQTPPITVPVPSPESLMAAKSDGLKPDASVPSAIPMMPPPPPRPESPPPAKHNLELSLGKDWLNRIGVLVLGLGVAFLIGYSFQYFGAWLKILTGYALGSLLFFGGIKLEKNDKLKNFGRVLLGGGWAFVYLTTYAMYHFEAARVVTSQALDLILLAVVAAGMILHSLKYKSEELVCVALGVAYLTSLIDGIGWFGVMSAILLALTGLFLVQRFRWIKTLITGIVFTYGISAIWGPNFNPQPDDLQKFVLLSSYWAIFLAGIHLIKISGDEKMENILSAANFGNIVIYSLLTAPLVQSLFPEHRALVALAEGIAYLGLAITSWKLSRRRLYTSDLVAGVFAVTLSICLKFLPTTSLVMYLVEIPFLLYVGIKFKEVIYRFFAYGLTLVCVLWYHMLVYSGMPDVVIGSWSCPWHAFIGLLGAISFAASFFILRVARKASEISHEEGGLDHGFSALSGISFTIFLWAVLSPDWRAFAIYMEGLALSFIGAFSGLGRFRAYSYTVYALASLSFLFASSYMPLGLVIANTLFPIASHYIVKLVKKLRKIGELFSGENVFSFIGSGLVLAVSTFLHAHVGWVELILIGSGAFFVVAGRLSSEKVERYVGYVLMLLGEGAFLVDGAFLKEEERHFVIWGSALLPMAVYYTERLIGQLTGRAEEGGNKALLAGATLVLGISIARFLPVHWAPVWMTLAGAFLALAGTFGRVGAERICAYVLMFCGQLFFYANASGIGYQSEMSDAAKWLGSLLPMISYYGLRLVRSSQNQPQTYLNESLVFFVLSTLCVAASVYLFLPSEWISLVLGLSGVGLVLAGFIGGERAERVGGLVLLGLTLLRIVLHDLSGLPVIFKIITFIVLGALLIGLSFLYNRFTPKK